MNEPIFDVEILGMNVFLEIEGRSLILPTVCGSMAFELAKIMGWDECKTLEDIMEREWYARCHEPAPRIRYWREMPTEEERKNGSWRERAWMFNFIGKNLSQEEINRRYEEWCATGRVDFGD